LTFIYLVLRNIIVWASIKTLHSITWIKYLAFIQAAHWINSSMYMITNFSRIFTEPIFSSFCHFCGKMFLINMCRRCNFLYFFLLGMVLAYSWRISSALKDFIVPVSWCTFKMNCMILWFNFEHLFLDVFFSFGRLFLFFHLHFKSLHFSQTLRFDLLLYVMHHHVKPIYLLLYNRLNQTLSRCRIHCILSVFILELTL